MFNSKVRTEPTPERVFELCRLVFKNKEMSEKKLKELLEPTALNSSSTSYFGLIRDVAIELELIKSGDKNLLYISKPEYVESLESFRRYCNSFVFLNTNSDFYKIAKCFLNSDDKWLKYKTLTDPQIIKNVNDETQIITTSPMLLGTRFWISFLGYGYIHESNDYIYYLPNMYVVLKDLLLTSNIDKNKEIPVSEIINILPDDKLAIRDNIMERNICNLAFSNGLRQLHDTGIITLKRNLDSRETWYLFKSEAHEFITEVTHILVKEIAQK